ncbi:MAG: hypothetical protein LC737_03355, partial [Chloroflexi bacterium]|nr:hypothetical protein [Chloroflexota bacterium]
AKPGDGLILDGPGQWTLAFYYLRGAPSPQYIPQIPDASELVDIDPMMRAIQQQHQALWVIAEQSTSVDPADNVARWLSLNAYPISRRWFKLDESVSHVLSERATQPATDRAIQFGEWLMLERAQVSEPRVSAGDGIAVRLTWHALKKIPQPMQLLVTLRLCGADGRLVQERVSKPCDGFCAIDDWIVGEPMDDRHGLLVPRDLTPGEYTLRLEVYAPRQQQSLPIVGMQSSSLELARIHVNAANGQ